MNSAIQLVNGVSVVFTFFRDFFYALPPVFLLLVQLTFGAALVIGMLQLLRR